MKRYAGVIVGFLILALWISSARADFSVGESTIGFTDVIIDGSFTTHTTFDVVVYNATGAALSPRLAVVPYTGMNCPEFKICVKPAPAAETEKVIGVVSTGLSGDGPVKLAVAGIFILDVTGIVSRGDLLEVSTTTDGKAMKAASGKFVFAVSLTDQPSAGGGIVYAMFSKSESW